MWYFCPFQSRGGGDFLWTFTTGYSQAQIVGACENVRLPKKKALLQNVWWSLIMLLRRTVRLMLRSRSLKNTTDKTMEKIITTEYRICCGLGTNTCKSRRCCRTTKILVRINALTNCSLRHSLFQSQQEVILFLPAQTVESSQTSATEISPSL